MNNIPFWKMTSANDKLSTDDWLLLDIDGIHAVLYLRNGGTTTVDLNGFSGRSYSIQWYDPKNGGDLSSASISSTAAGPASSVGDAPHNETQDWVVLLRCEGCGVDEVPTASTRPPTQKPVTAPSKSPVVVFTKEPTQTRQIPTTYPSLPLNVTNYPTAAKTNITDETVSHRPTYFPIARETGSNNSASSVAPTVYSKNFSSQIPSQTPSATNIRSASSSPTFKSITEESGEDAGPNGSGIGHRSISSVVLCLICGLFLF
jgi:hypothetical protein